MTLPPGLTLRPATLADAATLQAQRDAMFSDMGSAPERVRAASAASLNWLRAGLTDGSYSGVLIESEGQSVAGAGVIWQSLPPSPRSLTPLRAYILNVYVVPEHRGRGLAGQMLGALLTECRARGVKLVSLHASDAGRPTYEKLGFSPTNELRLTLEPS